MIQPRWRIIRSMIDWRVRFPAEAALAGTTAGPVSDAEQSLLDLRQLISAPSHVQRDAGVIRGRLERSGRQDPVALTTGQDVFARPRSNSGDCWPRWRSDSSWSRSPTTRPGSRWFQACRPFFAAPDHVLQHVLQHVLRPLNRLGLSRRPRATRSRCWLPRRRAGVASHPPFPRLAGGGISVPESDLRDVGVGDLHPLVQPLREDADEGRLQSAFVPAIEQEAFDGGPVPSDDGHVSTKVERRVEGVSQQLRIPPRPPCPAPTPRGPRSRLVLRRFL